MNMSIGIRVKDLRNRLGLTQGQLAEQIGISQNAIHKLEDGTTKNPRYIIELAKALECNVDWLKTGEGKIANTRNQTNTEEGPDITGYYPLIDMVSAGNWLSIREPSVQYNSKQSGAEMFPCPVKCSGESFVLRVQGISMEPMFRDGDLIFVDPNKEWRHGSYVVARLEGDEEAMFKQLIIESGRKYLKPLNPNWPEQIIPINGNCIIVGVVIFSGRQI